MDPTASLWGVLRFGAVRPPTLKHEDTKNTKKSRRRSFGLCRGIQERNPRAGSKNTPSPRKTESAGARRRMSRVSEGGWAGGGGGTLIERTSTATLKPAGAPKARSGRRPKVRREPPLGAPEVEDAWPRALPAAGGRSGAETGTGRKRSPRGLRSLLNCRALSSRSGAGARPAVGRGSSNRRPRDPP